MKFKVIFSKVVNGKPIKNLWIVLILSVAFVIGALGNVLVLTVLLQRTKKRSFGTFKQSQYNPTKTLLMNEFKFLNRECSHCHRKCTLYHR